MWGGVLGAARARRQNKIQQTDSNKSDAQAKDGAVWYCGEETASFDTFRGDRPQTPELVSIDGSFKAGRDGDKPGIIFQRAPAPGQVYGPLPKVA